VLEQDLRELARKVWDKHGVTPDQLFGSVTPSQFAALFARAPQSGFDRTEELIKYNRARGQRGLRPVIPSWL
jgi:hypothetical protein